MAMELLGFKLGLPRRMAMMHIKRSLIAGLIITLLFMVFHKPKKTDNFNWHSMGRNQGRHLVQEVDLAKNLPLDPSFNLERIKDELEKQPPLKFQDLHEKKRYDHSTRLPDSEVFVYMVHDMGDGTFLVFVRGLREEKDLHVDFTYCLVDKVPTKLLLINVETFLCVKPKEMPEDAIISVSYRTRDLKSDVTWGMRRNILKGRPPVPLCIATLMKDEAYVVDDWIRYHTRQGVQRFLIYDNNSTDNTPKILDSHPHVTRVFWPWSKTQYGAFTDALIQTRGVCTRTLLIDVDEYMYPKMEGQTLKSMLFDVPNLYTSRNGEKNPAAVCFRVKVMGSSNLIKRPNKTLSEAYIHYDEWYTAERGKCAIRPDRCYYTASVHHFPTNRSEAIVNRNKMYVVHYKYQCWDCYVQNKLSRERPSPKSRNYNASKVDANTPKAKWVGNPGLLDVEFRDYKRIVDKWAYPTGLFK